MANKTITAEPVIPCPECGGVVTIDLDAETETLVPIPPLNRVVERRRRPAVVAFCSSCEWAHEIRPEFLPPARLLRAVQ